MDERQLEEIAAKLGRDAESRLDIDRVAQRVVAELRKGSPRVTWRRPIRVLRAAAAILVLVTGGVIVSRLGGDTTVDSGAPVGLEEFSAAELAEVLDSLDLTTPAYELVPASLDDLDEAQLRELLAVMDG